MKKINVSELKTVVKKIIKEMYSPIINEQTLNDEFENGKQMYRMLLQNGGKENIDRYINEHKLGWQQSLKDVKRFSEIEIPEDNTEAKIFIEKHLKPTSSLYFIGNLKKALLHTIFAAGFYSLMGGKKDYEHFVNSTPEVNKCISIIEIYNILI